MLNGKTLKITFLSIIICLMMILISSTAMLLFSKLTVEQFKELLGFLGIPTLIGIIVQAFLHTDSNKDGVPDYQEGEINGDSQTPKVG